MAYKVLLDSVPVHSSELTEHPQWLSVPTRAKAAPAFVPVFSAWGALPFL